MFYVGQKVVCVDAAPTRSDGFTELVKGSIYTVRWCGSASFEGDQYYGLRVVEIFRGAAPGYFIDPDNIDQAFASSRFRPSSPAKQTSPFSQKS